MADELNIPTHRWYQKRNHIALAKEDFSRQFIYDSGIQKIDAWINSQPWGDVYIVNRLSPPLVLDFDDTYYRTGGTATDLVSAATHARASDATYVDADGILQTAGINEPRVGHHIWNGSAWVDEGYFHEGEARTNLVTYSEDFTDASWVSPYGENETVELDAEISPSGTTSATRLSDDASTGTGAVQIGQSVTVATSTDYTFSVFAKADNLNWIVLRPALFTTPSAQNTYFDLANGTIGTIGSSQTASVQDCGSGWYRCSITFTTDASDTNGAVVIRLADADGDEAVDLDGTSSVLIYGAQFEKGSTPSSYIPTNSGATVTRAADTLTILSANLPWNPLAVSIQMEGKMTYAETGTAGSTSGGSGDAVFYLLKENSSNYLEAVLATNNAQDVISFAQESSGVRDVVALFFGPTPGVNVPFNISSRHGSTFLNGAVDGVALTEDTTPVALPDLSATDMDIGFDFMGTIKLFRVWADDLTDAGIEDASA